MKTFTTLSDYGYLPLGLSMYDSIKNTTSGEFVMYYLCLDDKTYEKIESLKLNNLIPVHIKKLQEDNKDLAEYTISEYREFAFLLASYFTHYILITKKPDDVTYIDADLYFYGDIDYFYKEIGNKSIGIIRHRQIGKTENSPDGKYNVGIVYFKNTVAGRHILDWWRDAVMYRKYPQFGTCYDQKYLEAFEIMYPEDTCIADETFAHSSPWHHRLFDWSTYNEDSHITWEEKKQFMLFNHFSKFSHNIPEESYSPCGGHYAGHTLNFTVFDIPQIRKMYNDYFYKVKETVNKYML
jgi:hypothetical protein